VFAGLLRWRASRWLAMTVVFIERKMYQYQVKSL